MMSVLVLTTALVKSDIHLEQGRPFGGPIREAADYCEALSISHYFGALRNSWCTALCVHSM